MPPKPSYHYDPIYCGPHLCRKIFWGMIVIVDGYLVSKFELTCSSRGVHVNNTEKPKTPKANTINLYLAVHDDLQFDSAGNRPVQCSCDL